jgi:hypothetical protein
VRFHKGDYKSQQGCVFTEAILSKFDTKTYIKFFGADLPTYVGSATKDSFD